MELESGRAALISLIIIDGQQDEKGQVTAGGTAVSWEVPDGQIDYMQDQLHKLFGEPVIEILLPVAAQQVIEAMHDQQWPGAVKFTRDKGS
jgi:hypothetical protein